MAMPLCFSEAVARGGSLSNQVLRRHKRIGIKLYVSYNSKWSDTKEEESSHNSCNVEDGVDVDVSIRRHVLT